MSLNSTFGYKCPNTAEINFPQWRFNRSVLAQDLKSLQVTHKVTFVQVAT